MEHDAQLFVPRGGCGPPAASLRCALEGRATEVASRAACSIALNVNRFARVPSSRYFAVAGPNDRSRRSGPLRAAPAALGPRRDLGRRPHRDRFDALRTEHGTEATLLRVLVVVGDGGVADLPLPRDADAGDPPRGSTGRRTRRPRRPLRVRPHACPAPSSCGAAAPRRAAPTARVPAPGTPTASWPVSLPRSRSGWRPASR